MTEKKHAINISLVMITVAFIITCFFWDCRDEAIPSLTVTLSTGVFGSGFATLCIFVYEYNKKKRELLKAIFDQTNDLFCQMDLLYNMDRFGLYTSGMQEQLKNKYYTSPVSSDSISHMDSTQQCLYFMSRFADTLADIGYAQVQNVLKTIDEIDFWIDSVKPKSKLSENVKLKLSYPIYDVFVSAPAMEDGYIFRYCNQFKNEYYSDAFDFYPIVEKIDKALNGVDMNNEYHWLNTCLNMKVYMHEKLWAFRDAFYSRHCSRKERKNALKVFLLDKPFEK